MSQICRQAVRLVVLVGMALALGCDKVQSLLPSNEEKKNDEVARVETPVPAPASTPEPAPVSTPPGTEPMPAATPQEPEPPATIEAAPSDNLSDDERRWKNTLAFFQWKIPRIHPKGFQVGSLGILDTQPGEVVHVINADSVIVGLDGERVLLHGVKGRGLSRGRMLRVNDLAFEVDGNAPDPLSGGSRSLFTMRPVDRKRLEALAAEGKAKEAGSGSSDTSKKDEQDPNAAAKQNTDARAAAEAKVASAQSRLDATPIRTWKSADKKFELQAKLKSMTPDTVTLLRENGTEIKVPKDKLSPEDLDYIEEWKASRK
jgi:hypothetical protein